MDNKEEIRNYFIEFCKTNSCEIEQMLISSNPKLLLEVGLEEYKTRGNWERLELLFYLLVSNKDSFETLYNFTFKYKPELHYLCFNILNITSELSFKQKIQLLINIERASEFENIETYVRAKENLFYLYEENNIEFKFIKYTTEMLLDTLYISNPGYTYHHPNHIKVVCLGKEVLPYMFKYLQQEPYWWFSMLREITKEDPTNESMTGRLDLITKAWLNWAKKEGYIEDNNSIDQ